MDQHDQELLDKQLHQIVPARRNDGIIVLTILAVFFVGMTFGGVLSAYSRPPVQIASSDGVAAANPLTTLQ